MNLWNDLQSKYEPNTSIYKAIAVLLQNNKTHCKGYKVHSRERYLGGLHTIPENNLLQYLAKHIAMTK
jgi:hypothetical protein